MTKKQIIYILGVSAILLSCILYTVCKSDKESLQVKDYQEIMQDKLIRVAIQNNDAELDIHSDSIYGIFYNQIKSFAQSKGLEIEVHLLASIDEAIDGLKKGRYDIIASKVPVNALTKEELLLSTPIYKSREMLIQRKNDSTSIQSILQLSNKTIHIEKNSPAKLRIDNICKEIGDTIYTKEIDLYGEEHLIFLVSHGDIDYAVCNEHVAKSYKDSLLNIDFDTPLGFTQLYSFATNKQSKTLIDTLNAWIEKPKKREKDKTQDAMIKDTVKWGFIGCGEATKTKSGPAFQKVENSEIVAVMSRNIDKARIYAQERGIKKWYNDAQELIDDPEVNAVYIATPPSSHATYAIMAMKAGKPAYIEKPMAQTYEECTRINRISKETGVPCFVAYYRRHLPYFKKVKELIESGEIGNVINVQIRFAQPPRNMDYNKEHLPWRVQANIAGGGYFYDLAPHQLDLLQDMFGCILEAKGYKSNRGGLYNAEDTLSACFQFDNGLVGSGSWCFVAHDSAKEDRIEVIGDKGQICFSVFTYEPIALHTERGREEIHIENPKYVQQPLIQLVVNHLLGKETCDCDGETATLTNWVMDKILDKL